MVVRAMLPSLKSGAFAESIIIRDICLDRFSLGSRLRVGSSVILEITQTGKKCHNSGWVIKKATGDCTTVREGLFAKVVEGGSGQYFEIIRETQFLYVTTLFFLFVLIG